MATRAADDLCGQSALTGAGDTPMDFTDREGAAAVTFGAPRRVRRSDPMLLKTLSMLGTRIR